MVEALHVAEALPAVQNGDYELRCLQVPSLHFVGLWLHRPGHDIILPTAPTPAHLAALRAYSEAELLAQMAPLAAAKKRAYDADTTGKLGG
jgi:hypothetical protein